MQDYNTIITNTNGSAFPDTQAVNATGPTAIDGTEYVAELINDYWGHNQAIIDYAGLSPDGVTEAAGTAQVIEALQKGFGAPPGAIMEWPAVLDPAVSGHRAILLQGQGILHASYPDLEAVVYVGDGNNAAVAAGGGAFYKADNADGTSPNIAGIYLILPETRGIVPRGLDLAATIDPLGASRYLGDLQQDAFQGHWHNLQSTLGTDNLFVDESGTGASANGANLSIALGTTNALETTNPVTDGVNGTPRTSTETRMYNRSTTYIIWY